LSSSSEEEDPLLDELLELLEELIVSEDELASWAAFYSSCMGVSPPVAGFSFFANLAAYLGR